MSTATGTAGAPAAQPRAGARRLLRHWVPPQHGAWAMLLLPFAVGALRAGPGWIHLPLLVAWLAGYLFSYYGQLAIKTRTVTRVRPQLLGYGAITVAAGLPVVLARPALLWAAPAMAPLLAVNAWYARRRRERALPNGIASVVQSSLMTFVAAAAVGFAPVRVAGDAVALLLYFVGSLLYVKTMIRERGDVRYLRASIGFHVLAVAVAGWLSPLLLVPFGWLLVRAVVMPRRNPSVKQVGLLELPPSLLLVAVLLLVG